jgi:hypothetical protein
VTYLRHILFALFFALLLSAGLSVSSYAADWQEPTKEELSMTSQPEVPGADAVYLYREESSDDQESRSSGLDQDMSTASQAKNFHTIYVRLKILTEAGKKYADVPVVYPGRYFSVASVEGRTIHSDGTVIPFTGKPFQKEVYKTGAYTEKETFFTMPDVQVGSILEYRYTLRYDARILMGAEWIIQQDLFVRSAKYTFDAYGEGAVQGNGDQTTGIAYTDVLPKGAAVKQIRSQNAFELEVHNIPPIPSEEYMLPQSSLVYRVLFYYSGDRPQDFWADKGRDWARDTNKFLGSSNQLKSAVAEIVAPGDNDHQKLVKIYDAMMKLDNTDFTRTISAEELKQAGLRANSAADIWAQKRGNSHEITLLFIALARAAGLQAYAVRVTNRDENIFDINFLNTRQLNDYIAIVNVDGKEQFFDPGERYCEFGKLHWKHTSADAMRQTYDSTAMIKTPGANYQEAQTVRVAQLQLEPDGTLHGVITVKMTGVPALTWRQRALRSDEAEVTKEFENKMRSELPAGVDAHLARFIGLADWKSVLVAQFEVSGAMGTVTGKRVILPSSFFQEARENPNFSSSTRQTEIYLHYAYARQDTASIALPHNLEVESIPQDVKLPFPNNGLYSANYSLKDNTYTATRLIILANFLFQPSDYSALRDFYQKINGEDQEQAILKVNTTVAQQ